MKNQLLHTPEGVRDIYNVSFVTRAIKKES